MSMRGILVTNYGGPEVLQLRKDLILPLPTENQILIRVRACAITTEDLFIRSGGQELINNSENSVLNPPTLNLDPSTYAASTIKNQEIMKLNLSESESDKNNLDKNDNDELLSKSKIGHLKNSLPYTPGNQIAGFIEKIGENVKNISNLKVNDRVYTFTGCVSGGTAQFCTARASDCYRLPDSLTFRQGAVFGKNYFYAYHALTNKNFGNFKAGQHLAISMPWNDSLLIPLIQIGFALGAKKISIIKSGHKYSGVKKHFERIRESNNQVEQNTYRNCEFDDHHDGERNFILKETDMIENLLRNQIPQSSSDLTVLEVESAAKLSEKYKNDIDLLIDSQPHVFLNQILTCQLIKPRSGKICLISPNATSTLSTCIEDFRFEFLISNSITITGLSINHVKFLLDKKAKDAISLQLNRWVEHGLISPVVGKEYPLDQIRDGHRHQLVESGPFDNVCIIAS